MALEFEYANSDCNESQPESDDSNRNVYDEVHHEAAMQDLDSAIIAGELTHASSDDPPHFDVPF